MSSKILIVDDEPHFRFAASIALKRAGYDVQEASSGEEALSQFFNNHVKSTTFQLILMDILMPGISGIEMIKELNKRHVETPVLAVSGIADRDLVQELVHSHKVDLLKKPFEPKELIKKVKSILVRQEEQLEIEISEHVKQEN